MANDEMYTPKFIFDAMDVKFDLDVAAPKGGIPWIPAKDHYSVEDNALEQPWWGRVWMNPPYSKPSPWVDKWLNHSNGIALLPLSGNSRWWRLLWQSEASVVMMKPNTSFINKEGKEAKIMYGISLWAIGKENINALEPFGNVR